MSQTSSAPYDVSPSPSRESPGLTFRVLASGVQVLQADGMSFGVKNFSQLAAGSVVTSQPVTETHDDALPDVSSSPHAAAIKHHLVNDLEVNFDEVSFCSPVFHLPLSLTRIFSPQTKPRFKSAGPPTNTTPSPSLYFPS